MALANRSIATANRCRSNLTPSPFPRGKGSQIKRNIILSEVEGSEPALSILEGRSDAPSLNRERIDRHCRSRGIDNPHCHRSLASSCQESFALLTPAVGTSVEILRFAQDDAKKWRRTPRVFLSESCCSEETRRTFRRPASATHNFNVGGAFGTLQKNSARGLVPSSFGSGLGALCCSAVGFAGVN